MSNKNIVITILIVLLLVLVGYYIYNDRKSSIDTLDDTSNTSMSQSQRVTKVGTYVCLPHKDTSGTQTTECALGLKTSDGMYYALDFNLASQTVPEFKVGDNISVSGLFTPQVYLSADSMNKYTMEGIISVTDSVYRVDDDSKATTSPPTSVNTDNDDYYNDDIATTDGQDVDIIFPTGGENLTPGTTYALRWQGGGDIVNIYLIDTSGSSTLDSGDIIDTRYGITNTGSYNYMVQRFQPGTYEFRIGDATSKTFQVTSI